MKTDLRRLFNHWIPPRPAERWGCDICEGPFYLISISLEGSEWGCCHASECPRIADPVAVALLAKVLMWLSMMMEKIDPPPRSALGEFCLWLSDNRILKEARDREKERADRLETLIRAWHEADREHHFAAKCDDSDSIQDAVESYNAAQESLLSAVGITNADPLTWTTGVGGCEHKQTLIEERKRADRAERAYADRMKTLAGFQLELDSKKEREESLRRQLEAAHRTIADDAALLAIAKDFARNAAPILRLHNKLVEAAKAGDDRAVNRIVAELGLIESPL